MRNEDSIHTFQCTAILNSAVQLITIETGLDEEDEPFYKVFMPDGRILFLELDINHHVWRLQSGESTEESNIIGDLIIAHYM